MALLESVNTDLTQKKKPNNDSLGLKLLKKRHFKNPTATKVNTIIDRARSNMCNKRLNTFFSIKQQ